MLSGRTVSFSSDAPSVATVSPAGLVTGVAPGAATITAKSEGKSGALALTVVQAAVATVTLAAGQTNLEVGQAVQLTVTARDSRGATLTGRSTSYTSSTPTVATVSPTGLVTGTGAGSTGIVATVEGKTGTLDFTVTAPVPAASVTVDLASDLILEGTTTEVAVGRVLDANGNRLTGRTVTWSSSAPAVASIDASGRITAKAAGTSQITGSAEGKTGVATVTVEPRSRYDLVLDNQWSFITGGSDSRMPVWDAARQGFVPAAGDTREQIVIDETFSVPAGEEVTWENKIVWVRPHARQNIAVLGTLTIRRSLVLWDQTEHQQTRLAVKAGGTLRIEGSYAFQSNAYQLNWEYEDGATVFLDHFQGDPWTSAHGDVDYTSVNGSTVRMSIFSTVNSASINIDDAHQVWLELLVPSGSHQLSLPRRYRWQSENLESVWPGTIVSVDNSFIFRNDVALDNDTQATIVGATDGVGVGWSFHHQGSTYVDCEIRDLGDPSHDEGVTYADKTWSVPCNNSSLTLKNSLLLPSWPNVYGSVHLKIYNSNLEDLRNFGSGASPFATMEVYGSKMTLLSTTNGGLTYVENSTVKQDIQVNGAGSTVYGFGFTKVGGTPVTVTEESGGTYVSLATAGVPWG